MRTSASLRRLHETLLVACVLAVSHATGTAAAPDRQMTMAPTGPPNRQRHATA